MDLCGFHGFLGTEVGHPVAGCGGILRRSLDPFVSLQDQILDNFDDSMIRCIEPGSLESWMLAARMVIFIDFHGIEGSVILGLIFYGFHRLSVISNGFVRISWIPTGSGVPGLIFCGFHRFYMILGGFVWISWIPGHRGRATCGAPWRRVRRESCLY